MNIHVRILDYPLPYLGNVTLRGDDRKSDYQNILEDDNSPFAEYHQYATDNLGVHPPNTAAIIESEQNIQQTSQRGNNVNIFRRCGYSVF